MSSHNKYALVTGGSSGMGLEYVRILAAKNYNVIIVALFQNETDAVRDEMAGQYPDLDFLSVGVDLSAVDAPRRVFDTVRVQRPEAEVEVLVNNAGMLHPMHFRNMPPEKVSSIIMVHNHATAMLCRYFLPGMLERGKGYILNIWPRGSLSLFSPLMPRPSRLPASLPVRSGPSARRRGSLCPPSISERWIRPCWVCRPSTAVWPADSASPSGPQTRHHDKA